MRKWIVIGLVASIGLVFLVPLAVNWLFGQVAPCKLLEAKWGAEDALGYGGSVLSFLGTVVLGVVAVVQTRKAHEQADIANSLAVKANEQTEIANQLAREAGAQTERANELAAQMQKMEQAKFVSMVSVQRVMLAKRSVDTPAYINTSMTNIEQLDMNAGEMATSTCYHIDIEFRNESVYPIVQVFAHGGGRWDNNAVLYNIKDAESAIYIPPNNTQAIRFIVPTEIFEKYKENKLSLSLTFVNIFDYSTLAQIHIKNLGDRGETNRYSYRLAKFTDIRPTETPDGE